MNMPIPQVLHPAKSVKFEKYGMQYVLLSLSFGGVFAPLAWVKQAGPPFSTAVAQYSIYCSIV